MLIYWRVGFGSDWPDLLEKAPRIGLKKELTDSRTSRSSSRESSKRHVLIGGLEHEFYFFHILGIIIPTEFHIFQRGRSTTNHSETRLRLSTISTTHKKTEPLKNTSYPWDFFHGTFEQSATSWAGRIPGNGTTMDGSIMKQITQESWYLPGLVNFHITIENHHFQWENPL